MKLDWTHRPDTPATNEMFISGHGFIINEGAEGWSAFAALPRKGDVLGDDNLLMRRRIQVGECYKSAASAKLAVERYVERFPDRFAAGA